MERDTSAQEKIPPGNPDRIDGADSAEEDLSFSPDVEVLEPHSHQLKCGNDQRLASLAPLIDTFTPSAPITPTPRGFSHEDAFSDFLQGSNQPIEQHLSSLSPPRPSVDRSYLESRSRTELHVPNPGASSQPFTAENNIQPECCPSNTRALPAPPSIPATAQTPSTTCSSPTAQKPLDFLSSPRLMPAKAQASTNIDVVLEEKAWSIVSQLLKRLRSGVDFKQKPWNGLGRSERDLVRKYENAQKCLDAVEEVYPVSREVILEDSA